MRPEHGTRRRFVPERLLLAYMGLLMAGGRAGLLSGVRSLQSLVRSSSSGKTIDPAVRLPAANIVRAGVGRELIVTRPSRRKHARVGGGHCTTTARHQSIPPAARGHYKVSAVSGSRSGSETALPFIY